MQQDREETQESALAGGAGTAAGGGASGATRWCCWWCSRLGSGHDWRGVFLGLAIARSIRPMSMDKRCRSILRGPLVEALGVAALRAYRFGGG